MIDAFEIGIELALQDGVNAGLGVIARGLETLDRAVAATKSAGRLDALTAVAQGATQAVAAAGATLVPTVAEPIAAIAEPAAAGVPVMARAAMSPGGAATAPAADFERPVMAPLVAVTAALPSQAAPVAAMAALIGAMPTVAAPAAVPATTPIARAIAAVVATPPVAGPTAAPMRAAAPIVPRPLEDDKPASPGRAKVAGPAGRATVVPAAPIMPAAVEAMRVASPLARAGLAMKTPRATQAAPVAPVAPIAAMGPTRTVERGMHQRPDAPPPRVPSRLAVPQAPAAPIAGRLGGLAAMPGRELLPGSPAVPPSQAQDGGKTGGDVMLDGRLVGALAGGPDGPGCGAASGWDDAV